MNLKIDNFAKVYQADIKINGITVIAGENNTGKSTIGKILFSLFNSMSEFDTRIEKQQIEEIEKTLYGMAKAEYPSIRDYFDQIGFDDVIAPLQALKRPNINGVYKILEKRLFSFLEHLPLAGSSALLCKKMSQRVYAIMALPENTLKAEVLTRYFGDVFHHQINSLTEDSVAKLLLTVQGKSITVNFTNNACSTNNADFSLTHKAIYIDNPFILDTLATSGAIKESLIESTLKTLLTKTSIDIMDGIIDSVIVKEKLREVYKTLHMIIPGDIVEKQNREFYLQDTEFTDPVAVSNLSAGLKSFAIIKLLLEKGAIKEKDVLILDEPEIHLHPQWQIAYAELIVLLQKYFDLSIIITTHSPYFLDAIDLFSVKHGIADNANYYLSEMEESKVKMLDVTDNIELIYRKMVSPIETLDTLRHELNSEE